jgi:hypothetical protein
VQPDVGAEMGRLATAPVAFFASRHILQRAGGLNCRSAKKRCSPAVNRKGFRQSLQVIERSVNVSMAVLSQGIALCPVSSMVEQRSYTPFTGVRFPHWVLQALRS